MIKCHDCLVSETGEFHSFFIKADAEQFVKRWTGRGMQVLQGISYITKEEFENPSY